MLYELVYLNVRNRTKRLERIRSNAENEQVLRTHTARAFLELNRNIPKFASMNELDIETRLYMILFIHNLSHSHNLAS